MEADGVEYLGFVFRGRRATINVTEKNIQKFRHRIRQLTGRSRGISMDRRLSELRSYLRGWLGYFGLAPQLKLFDKLDQWLRRRLRMCYWKGWRYARRRRELGEQFLAQPVTFAIVPSNSGDNIVFDLRAIR